jgi:hypothetical protein
MTKKTIYILLLCFFLSGCQALQQTADQISGTAAIEKKKAADATLAKIKCQELCQDAATNGQDLSAGPCLANELINDWVCDIAHDPRQAVDNKPENQCLAFREGKAHHFVEVDGNCNSIKSN